MRNNNSALSSSQFISRTVSPVQAGLIRWSILLSINIPANPLRNRRPSLCKNIRLELAGLEIPTDWRGFLQGLLSHHDDVEILEVAQAKASQRRMAYFKNGQVHALLYTSNAPISVSREWAGQQLLTKPNGISRHRLLAGAVPVSPKSELC